MALLCTPWGFCGITEIFGCDSFFFCADAVPKINRQIANVAIRVMLLVAGLAFKSKQYSKILIKTGLRFYSLPLKA